MRTATIVIAATGAAVLQQAIASALAQDHAQTQVWVVIDGPEFEPAADAILGQWQDPRLRVLRLPENVGARGFYGHRIYAAMGHLVNSDYICLLDQDNWMTADHVSSLISAIETNHWQWAHSLRSIHDKNGAFITEDNCESLGRWPIYLSDQHHLVDTSCYCIKREVFQQISAAWHWGWGADRRFLAAINQHFPSWGTSGLHTLCYRLAGNAHSVNREFFDKGNAVMAQRYPAGLPWLASAQKTLDTGRFGASVSI